MVRSVLWFEWLCVAFRCMVCGFSVLWHCGMVCGAMLYIMLINVVWFMAIGCVVVGCVAWEIVDELLLQCRDSVKATLHSCKLGSLGMV